MELEEAYKIVESERAERCKICMDEIKQLLEKYRCNLEMDLVKQGVAFIPKFTVVPIG